MKIGKKQIDRELRRIGDSMPKEYKEQLVEMVDISPSVRETFIRASTDPDISEELRQKAINIIKSGYLDKKVPQVNQETTKKINDYWDEQIALSIKLGRLPEKPPKRHYERIMKTLWKKNEKKQQNEQ